MYVFEKLEVWRKSMVLAKALYESQLRFPPQEKFNLGDQLRRAAVSVSLNIAEGTGCSTDRYLKKYLLIARSSLYEAVTILKLSRRASQSSWLRKKRLVFSSYL